MHYPPSREINYPECHVSLRHLENEIPGNFALEGYSDQEE